MTVWLLILISTSSCYRVLPIRMEENKHLSPGLGTNLCSLPPLRPHKCSPLSKKRINVNHMWRSKTKNCYETRLSCSYTTGRDLTWSDLGCAERGSFRRLVQTVQVTWDRITWRIVQLTTSTCSSSPCMLCNVTCLSEVTSPRAKGYESKLSDCRKN